MLISPNAEVSRSATIGRGTKIWALSQVRENALIGEDCSIGRSVYIGAGVRVGNRCKIQNGALLYEPATVADGVFIGPAVIFTNDRLPRAITVDGKVKTSTDWFPVGVIVEHGASIGSGSICVAPVRIGSWAMVAAGSTVTADVPDYALVAGAPARFVAWIGRDGQRMRESGAFFVDDSTGFRFKSDGASLTKVT